MVSWYPHPNAAGLVKPRGPDTQNRMGNPQLTIALPQVLPFSQGMVEDSDLGTFTSPAGERGPSLHTEVAPMIRLQLRRVSISQQVTGSTVLICSRESCPSLQNSQKSLLIMSLLSYLSMKDNQILA